MPRRNTTSYSNPLAECKVIRLRWLREHPLPENVAIVAFSSSFPLSVSANKTPTFFSSSRNVPSRLNAERKSSFAKPSSQDLSAVSGSRFVKRYRTRAPWITRRSVLRSIDGLKRNQELMSPRNLGCERRHPPAHHASHS